MTDTTLPTHPSGQAPDRSRSATRAEPAVSLIIPACNAADTIGRCLDSVLRQLFGDVEIIVVDDGSRDGTAHRVAAMAEAHPDANIRVVRQANAGVSVARNQGLALARGRYVMFIDADDALAEGALAALWSRAERDNLDVLLANAWWHDFSGGAPRLMLAEATVGVEWGPGLAGKGRDWIIGRVAERRLKHYVWCQFIRREWLVRAGIRFVPGITHQDIVWTNQVLGAARRVGFLDCPVYHYHQRAGSLSQPRDSAARLRTARHYVRVAQELDLLAARTHHAALRAAYAWQAVEEGIAVLHAARHLTPSDRERLFRLVQSSGHAPLLWRNARGARHAFRVMKRCARYAIWRAAGALAHALRPVAALAGRSAPPQVADTRFGAD